MQTINWKNKIIYQIFPRSFYDANNDGNGDIKGIIKKLDYLQELGINAIWLCPTFDTKFKDAGYDVINYKSVWKQFGTLEDFKVMTSEAKKRGIDIIIDIVLNHVSSDHRWFQQALKSEKNKEHNYFIWRKKLNQDEKKSKSIFGGSAWEYVSHLDKYYFHLFSKEQVDLNWEHPDTIQAMADVIDFWYKIGVRGFRMDAIKHISKAFPSGNYNDFSWGPTTVTQLQKFNKIAFVNKEDAFTFGEATGITPHEMIKFGHGQQKVASNYFNFSWWHLGWGKETGRNGYNPNWNFEEFVNNMKSFQEEKGITPELMTNFLSNHDTSRAISRWGSEHFFWKESAKTLALMLFSLKGIPVIYYGEEIGMLNPRFKSRTDFKDVDALNAYDLLVDKSKHYTEIEMTKYLNINGRDNCRTPMQWDETLNSGFNLGFKPWIKIGYNYQTINVAAQKQDHTSIWHFYKQIIDIRKSKKYQDILVNGEVEFTILPSGLFQIIRKYQKQQILIIINIRDKHVAYEPPQQAEVILQTWSDNKKEHILLRSFESIMFEIK